MHFSLYYGEGLFPYVMLSDILNQWMYIVYEMFFAIPPNAKDHMTGEEGL